MKLPLTRTSHALQVRDLVRAPNGDAVEHTPVCCPLLCWLTVLLNLGFALPGPGGEPAKKDERSLLTILLQECLKDKNVWLFAITYFFVYVVRQVRSVFLSAASVYAPSLKVIVGPIAVRNTSTHFEDRVSCSNSAQRRMH